MQRTRLLARTAGFLATLTVLGPVASLCAGAAASDDGLPTVALTVGFTESAFLGVNQADLAAGYKVLAQMVGERRGYEIVSEVRAFKDADDIETLLFDETVRVVVMSSWVFLDIDTRGLTPMFIGSLETGLGRSYVLLARRDREWNTLADLRGTDLVVFELANASLGRYWIEVLVEESGLGGAGDFFAHRQYVHRPSSAVLPVFFGNKQACVVDREGFELMKEMNPQLGRELQVIAESDVLVDTVMCLRNDSWPEGGFRGDLIQTLGELHRETAGAQILTLFKTDQLVPFREEYLANTRALRAAHDRLRERNTVDHHVHIE